MKKIFVLICVITAWFSVSAQTYDYPWTIGLYGGKVEYNGEYGNKFFNIPEKFYGSAGLSVSRFLSERFDATLFGAWGYYGAKDSYDVEFKSGMWYGDLTLKFKIITNEMSLFRPYIFLGVGTRYLYQIDLEQSANVDPGVDFVIPGGIGCDLRLGDKWTLRYVATYGYSFNDEHDKRECGKYGDQQLLHNLGITYSFAFKSRDSDGDGVPDKIDECPGTPEAAWGMVDEKGCPIDSDGDGVPDYLDECPNTPAEARGMVDEKGCPKDSDGDGVADYLDKCPSTPAAARGTVDEKGCPKDSDGDGVPDYLDKCPRTPAAARGMIDETGCPKDSDGDGVADFEDKCPDVPGILENKGCPEIKQEVKEVFQKALNGIEFDSGRATIKRSSNKILDDIVKIMLENPAYLLSINGHTDNTGQAAKNQTLSEERANAVKNYLESKGVRADRMTAQGFGQDQPVTSNSTAAGRAKNRRVEFVVNF
jgi:outer membrane protein OmpA-like peptidoglycan-associated protein